MSESPARSGSSVIHVAGEGEILSLGEYADFLFYFFLHSFLLNKLPGFLKMYKEALHPETGQDFFQGRRQIETRRVCRPLKEPPGQGCVCGITARLAVSSLTLPARGSDGTLAFGPGEKGPTDSLGAAPRFLDGPWRRDFSYSLLAESGSSN